MAIYNLMAMYNCASRKRRKLRYEVLRFYREDCSDSIFT